MPSKKLPPSKCESLGSTVGTGGSSIVLLVKSAAGATLFALATFAPTPSRAVMPAVELATAVLSFVSVHNRRGFVSLQLIVSDRAQSDTAIKVLQKLDVIEESNPSMALQIADARKFALALPSGLTIPRVWTDGESEVVLEWINGEKHAIVSFEGDGEFGYAMRRGDSFAPGNSVNNVDLAALDDLIDYLAHS